MTPKERADRAQQITDDPVVKEALAEMEHRAIEDLIAIDPLEGDDTRRRISAERIREIRDFRHRLEMAVIKGAPAKERTIA